MIRQRDGLDLSFQELDVFDPGFRLAAAGQLQHLIGHVEPVHLAGRPNPARREEDIEATTRTKVENHLAVLESGHGSWVSASKRGQPGRIGKSFGRESCVRIGIEPVAGCRIGPPTRTGFTTLQCGGCGAVADRFFDVCHGYSYISMVIYVSYRTGSHRATPPDPISSTRRKKYEI